MCGRYSQKYTGRKLGVHYKVTNRAFEFPPNLNVCPTQLAPVVVAGESGPELRTMKWGLIPPWAKSVKDGLRAINAKAETLDEKPTFKSSFKNKRIIVPANSFFEWREEEEVHHLTKKERAEYPKGTYAVTTGRIFKQAYQFTVNGQLIFSLAGLYSIWKSPEGQEIESFTIITTEPNELMAPYHNRMPVIILPENERLWIDPAFTNPVLLKGLLKPYPSDKMTVEIFEKKAAHSIPVKKSTDAA